MENTKIYPNLRLTLWGVGYLLFQMLALPTVLTVVFYLADLPLDESRLHLLYYIVNFAALVAIFWRFLVDSLQQAAKNIGAVLIPAAVCFFSCRLASRVMDIGIYYLFPDFFNVNDANIATMAQGAFPMWAFSTVVLVPIAEELVFRGALLGGFYPKHKVLGWIVSALAFCLVHMVGYIGIYSWDILLIGAVQYLPASICLAAAYHKSGNIFAPILIHAATNAIAMVSIALM